MKKDFIHVVSINVNGSVYYDEIENSLEEFQNQVDGFIETIPLFDNYVLIVDEEGKLKESPMSCVITNNHDVVDYILGDCFITKINGEDFDDIDEQEVLNVLKHIHAFKDKTAFVVQSKSLFGIRIELNEEGK